MRIPARYATIEEICLVHTRAHYDFIEETKNRGDGDLLAVEKRFDSVYFNQLTWQSALLSAGGAIETCRAVASRQLKNAIAVIRPPGHHAEENRPMGFCMFDNVAIAAKVCQIDYKQTCRKILIVDWDVHHGNGIQQAFYSNPNVLYVSLHVHEDGRFYPAGPYGDHLHCGTGAGEGKNINVPWPTKGMGDADYMFAFQHIVMPVAHDFDPDLVIIAAGFDAAAGDQLGGCFVTPTCYAHMTHMLMSLAEGKLVVCLEGGYNLKSISKSALAVTRTLMGEPPDRMEETTATPSGIATVQKVVMYQSRYWRCLYPKDNDREISNSLGAERMHDVIRAYQSKHLYDTHKMISLFIFRERISRSFENQVIATTNYHKAVPLIVIFHDPPEVMGVPNPVTNKLELHNTWLADVLKHYIGWAVKQGFGVIDVNIPKHLTGIDDGTEYFEENKLARTAATEELAVYLWENYIECNDAQEIFFVGVGDAYHGVMHLLNNHEGFFERIAGVINFVAENPLRSVHDQNVYYLSKWYYKNSLVFVADNHLVWSPDGPLAGKKSTKRYGAFIRSPKVGLNEMLVVHQQQVQQFILQRVRRRSLAEAGSGRTATEVEGGVGTGMGPGMGSRMGTGSAGLLENAMSIETTMGMGEP
ncbi:Histone deacetylase hda1 [Hypocenomyce scalaris]|nr:Histone deacetylase hda1 [Hypocenomyce scalaris]